MATASRTLSGSNLTDLYTIISQTAKVTYGTGTFTNVNTTDGVGGNIYGRRIAGTMYRVPNTPVPTIATFFGVSDISEVTAIRFRYSWRCSVYITPIDDMRMDARWYIKAGAEAIVGSLIEVTGTTSYAQRDTGWVNITGQGVTGSTPWIGESEILMVYVDTGNSASASGTGLYDNLIFDIEYTPTASWVDGVLKYYNGSSWQAGVLKYYNGSSWVSGILKKNG